MLNRRFLNLVCIAIAVGITGCASAPTPLDAAHTIAHNSSLTTLNGLLEQTGVSTTLKGAGPFTVFAPSNEAFKSISAQTIEDLTKHPEKLKYLLTHHVVAGKINAADVKNSSVKTLNDSTVAISKAGDFVTIEDAMVQQADIQVSNGVIHIIDSVLTPPVKK